MSENGIPEWSDNNDKPDIDKVLKHILNSANQYTDDHEHADTLGTYAINLSTEPTDRLVQSLVICILSMADMINSTSVSHIVSCIDDKNVSEAYRRTNQYLIYGMLDWMGRDEIDARNMVDVITDMMTVQIAIINYVMDKRDK